jgi:hypothetical protein
MTDPERLLRNPGGPLSSLLMRAGAEERPPAAARRRTAKAVAAAVATVTSASVASASSVKLGSGSAATGLAGGATASASASGLTSMVGAGAVAKWFALGALGGALAAPLALTVMPTPAAQPAPPFRTQPADPPDARGARQAPEKAPPNSAVVASTIPPVRDVPSAVEAPPLLDPAPQASDPAKPAALARPDAVLLAAEVAFVDHGRAALQRGAVARALELLAPYEARFPQQQLLTEVLYLRMETLARLGDIERARSLAARVVSRGVAGPQAARAREVLGR